MGARLGYQTHQFLCCIGIGALENNDSSDTFVHKRRGQHYFFDRDSDVY
jgi:hypothetical protein